MRRLVLGDPHGGYEAMMDVLFASEFNYEKDQLFCLGDVADGWPQVPECFEELLKIKNLIYIIGNHDEWLYQWFLSGVKPYIWTSQGGQATLDAYIKKIDGFGVKYIESHKLLLQNAYNYYVTDDNKCFVHGGFDWHYPIANESRTNLMWDRHLFQTACMWQTYCEKDKPLYIAKEFNEVFVGHTTTSWSHPDLKPVHVSNVWNLDQGGGYEGKLTLMDVDTKEYWQSDFVNKLYPHVRGR
jgi:serine/threonine protein phosphatase 1